MDSRIAAVNRYPGSMPKATNIKLMEEQKVRHKMLLFMTQIRACKYGIGDYSLMQTRSRITSSFDAEMGSSFVLFF